MPEGLSVREVEPTKPIADAVRDIFERRATHGDRKLIMELYQKKLEDLINTIPKQHHQDAAVALQRGVMLFRGAFLEYSARFVDFVRNVVLWPMVRSDKDFPKDKYYQIELARAEAWGEFGKFTTKTATAERTAYRNHFLSSSISHAQSVGLSWGLTTMAIGALEGAKVGTVVGLGAQGAAVGAVVGGIAGGAYSAGMYVKDLLMGPPTVFYDLHWGAGKRSVGTPPIPSNGSGGGIAPATVMA